MSISSGLRFSSLSLSIMSFSIAILPVSTIIFFPLFVGVSFTALVAWLLKADIDAQATIQIGRASCRERV